MDERPGLSESLGSRLSDGRQGSKVRHSVLDLLRQRVFAIARGHADGNDAARLADDPAMKLPVGRDPVSGAALARPCGRVGSSLRELLAFGLASARSSG